MAATAAADFGRAEEAGVGARPPLPPPDASMNADGRKNNSKITIKNLDFFYGATKALKAVSLDIRDRRVTGVIGPSGCGKSTLLRVLNRMYDLYPGQRASGEVMMDGMNIIDPKVD